MSNDTQRKIQTRFAKPPRVVTPALAAARRRWYASNPWRPDWSVHERALKSAHDCMRERKSA